MKVFQKLWFQKDSNPSPPNKCPVKKRLPHYCLECGGDLAYDPALRQYVCKSCGLTFTLQQLLEAKGRFSNYQEDIRKKRQKEYLKWWLSKK